MSNVLSISTFTPKVSAWPSTFHTRRMNAAGETCTFIFYSWAQIRTPYRNPSPLGEVDGCFFGLKLLCNHVGPFRLPKKRVRGCEILIHEKNRWEDFYFQYYISSLHLYIWQKESTDWFFLKNFISSKELFFLIMFFATCRHFFSARVDTRANRVWSRSCDLLHVNDWFKRFIQWKAWGLFN